MPWCETFKYKIGPGECRSYDVVDVQVELKLLIDNNAKIFNMVYYWQCRASYSKVGFCTRDLVANMDMHNCTFLNWDTQLPLTAPFFNTFQLVTQINTIIINVKSSTYLSIICKQLAYTATITENVNESLLDPCFSCCLLMISLSMISLINNTKSKGPITLPCTIPLQRYNRHDKQLPTRVCWVRQFKKLLILFNRLPLIP